MVISRPSGPRVHLSILAFLALAAVLCVSSAVAVLQTISSLWRPLSSWLAQQRRKRIATGPGAARFVTVR